MMRTSNLKQRAEFTFKYNVLAGRHGWLRLTPAYSVKVVESILGNRRCRARVLDPFAGTGTTGLCAIQHGHNATMLEINPFLLWLGRAKTDRYSREVCEAARKAAQRALKLITARRVAPEPAPPLHNIERWWPSSVLRFLQTLKAAINEVTASTGRERTLLQIAFCRTLIKLSNAAFNHQSMSFKDVSQIDMFVDGRSGPLCQRIFWDDVQYVIDSASDNVPGNCRFVQGDAREVERCVRGRYDLVITSPPYANRISYIRELRPYMYWLGYLKEGRDAAELDWASIGGTWGVATSRLLEWRPDGESYRPGYLDRILERIADEGNSNGRLLANYVAKYFEDIWTHFRSSRRVLSRGAEVHYIVGNSTFYGVLVPTERVYADMLGELGFSGVEIRPLRKRNSKKELVEFDVSAKWNGR